jgi:acyl transferase domain-containing protein
MAPDAQRTCLLGICAESSEELCELAAAASEDLRDPGAASVSGGPRKGGLRLLARGASAPAVAQGLAAFAAGEPDRIVEVQEQPEVRPTVAFVFAGQSEVRPGMGAELYLQNPCFVEVLDRCSLTLGETLGTTVAAAIYDSDDAGLLDDARFAQPALFALQVALAAVWRQWGVVPDMVSGHSLGEYAAACVAGAIGVEDGMRLVGARGAITRSRARSGLMAVLFATEEDVTPVVADKGEGVSIAAINAPEVVVISGEADTVTEVLADFDARGVNAKVLHISHPFHSVCIDPMLDELEEAVASTPIGPPKIPFASALGGRFLEPHESLDATYWRRHAREPVRFLEATQELARAGCTIYLELGPHATLTGLGQRCVDEATSWLPSLKRTGNDYRVLTDTAAKLWLAGVDVDLAAMADNCGWELLEPPGTGLEQGAR